MNFSSNPVYATVQIAGVSSLDEARLLEELEVDFVGFPLRLGYHTPDISEDEACRIISEMKYPERAVLITYLTSADDVIQLSAYLGVRAVQLHGDISAAEVAGLRSRKQDWLIIKSLIVRPEMGSSDEALKGVASAYEENVDAFITDTFDPRTTASGATGLTHNWEVSAGLARSLSKPLILAGGLKAENVADAIRIVGPAAVDAHSGVEGPDGKKQRDLVAAFVSEARRAFNMG